jgi:phage gpG-like protein
MGYKWFGAEVSRELTAMTEAGLTAIAADIASAAKAKMREEKHGVEPQTEENGRKPTGFTTRRSAPGEAPAIQTGALLRSITWEKPAPLVRRVGTNLKYGAWLELGTKSKKTKKTRIAPRPFLRPAMDESKGRAEKVFINKLGGG